MASVMGAGVIAPRCVCVGRLGQGRGNRPPHSDVVVVPFIPSSPLAHSPSLLPPFPFNSRTQHCSAHPHSPCPTPAPQTRCGCHTQARSWGVGEGGEATKCEGGRRQVASCSVGHCQPYNSRLFLAHTHQCTHTRPQHPCCLIHHQHQQGSLPSTAPSDDLTCHAALLFTPGLMQPTQPPAPSF